MTLYGPLKAVRQMSYEFLELRKNMVILVRKKNPKPRSIIIVNLWSS